MANTSLGRPAVVDTIETFTATPRRARGSLWIGPTLAVLAALAFVALVAVQLLRPLMYDDANFAFAARAVADTGVPFGNQGWMSERGDFSQREQWALWHPPLYVYVLGLFAKLGGLVPAALRLPGLLGGLATGALAYLLAAELTRGSPRQKTLAGGVAAALVLLNPLVVQSALILDIDLTLLLPLTLLIVLLYLRLEHTRTRWLWLVPLFGLLLWAKMTNPLPLLAVLGVWQILRGQPRRAVVHVLGIGCGGAALFLASWAAVASSLGFPFDMPFGVNLVQWQDSAEVARRAYESPGAFIEGLQPTVLWVGPGLVALGLAAATVRGPQLVQAWRFRGVDILIGLAILLAAGYVYKSAGWFTKYQVALVPLFACAAAPLLIQAWCSRPRIVTGVSTLLTLPAAFAAVRVVRDDWLLQRTWAISPEAGAWLLAPVVAGLLLGLPWRAPGATALAGVFAVALGTSIGSNVFLAGVPYSTPYWYGTRGTLEAAAWVDRSIGPDETYAASKEVAFAARAQRYVDQDTLVYYLGSGRGLPGATWAGEPLRAVVAWEREPYVADLFARHLPQVGLHPTARFGDYTIYEPAR